MWTSNSQLLDTSISNLGIIVAVIIVTLNLATKSLVMKKFNLMLVESEHKPLLSFLTSTVETELGETWRMVQEQYQMLKNNNTQPLARFCVELVEIKVQRVLALNDLTSALYAVFATINYRHFTNLLIISTEPIMWKDVAFRGSFGPFIISFCQQTHVFASPVAPSSLRPSPRLRLARRPVFASPVAPSSLRPSPRLRFARRPVFTSWSPRHRLVFVGSGSAVLPNGLYAMGGTVAQAVWLKVDRRGNAPLGTPPLSML
ncbi:hypothetical protein OUZ56_015743 [Daphnia magna]|uniref:Uncharacterized protein n=1 Tax=Daphnia magna TaxID=35525 RepID=A0ABR0ANL7_9CRUS|nr:hypothetical protein OUZ56_015743 [Daphnia magna]